MSVVIGLLGWVAQAIDLLPFYGVCAVPHDEAVDIWFFAPFLLALALAVWTLGALIVAPFWKRHRWSWFSPLLAFAVLSALFFIGQKASYVARTIALDRFADDMVPVVAAVEDHITQHGSPPEALELVATPLPATDLCADEELAYKVESDNDWKLVLTLYDSYPGKGLMIYRSNGELRYRERRIRDWVWQKWDD